MSERSRSELSLRGRIIVAVVASVVLLGSALGYAVAVHDSDSVDAVGSVSLSADDRLLVLTQRHVATVAAVPAASNAPSSSSS